jgi:EAL domain-containing protein (putative c-di-GMP-specific phosphodiesterase class I)
VHNDAFRQLGIKETIKLSVGLAHASGMDIGNLSELPRQADVAMYHAKSSTRDKIVHYVPSLEQNASALVSNRIVGAVLNALETGEGIDMHYQPLVDASSHVPVHYEALVRISDAGGPISPMDIFPIIARRRLDVELDKAVLRAIERDLQSGGIPRGVGISVNVSGALLALNEFCEYFSGLAKYLDNHPIIIEITETSFISHLQHASDCLRKLRQNGFLVALDDFGSGYSSIRYLANMPVDIVKFDIAMVHDLNKDQRTRVIIEQTAALIRQAGYKLIAEGIESAEILQRAEALGASYYQGFLFGRPQPLSGVFAKAAN